ncbi:MAG: hypothetical protein ACXVZ3_15425, partial [Gaiellaceae bacterium]
PRNGVLDTPEDLTVTTSDATPFIARAVTWHITKDADHGGRLAVAPGGTATFTYTLTVTHEIGAEIEWLVFGTIHVHNPNVSDVSGVDVTDAVDNGGTCTVEGDAVHTVTIPGGNTLDFNYLCSYTSSPIPSSGTNRATVTWPPSTSVSSDPEAFDFAGVEPQYANGSVDVTDLQDPEGATVGSVSVDDPNPSRFTYSVDFPGDPAGACTGHANTARLMIDALMLGSDTRTVEVCVGAGLGVTNRPSRPKVSRRIRARRRSRCSRQARLIASRSSSRAQRRRRASSARASSSGSRGVFFAIVLLDRCSKPRDVSHRSS